MLERKHEPFSELLKVKQGTQDSRRAAKGMVFGFAHALTHNKSNRSTEKLAKSR